MSFGLRFGICRTDRGVFLVDVPFELRELLVADLSFVVKAFDISQQFALAGKGFARLQFGELLP